MAIFEFLKFIPKPAIFFLLLTSVFFVFGIFSLFKRKLKLKQERPAAPPLTTTETPSSPKKNNLGNLLLILTIIFLLLSFPLALVLVEQRQEIGMKAKTSEEQSIASTTKEVIPTPTWVANVTPTSRCNDIKAYKGDTWWTQIEKEELPNLTTGETIRIAVKGDPNTFDKGRIRINSMEWTPENETTSQKPNSAGEFYIECEVGIAQEKATICGISANPDDSFKIEAELHDKKTGQWW